MHVCAVPRDDWDEYMNLLGYTTTKRHSLPTNLLRDETWSIEDPRAQALLAKISKTGIPLREYTDSCTYRGPVTGLNDAFYLDAGARDRLIRELTQIATFQQAVSASDMVNCQAAAFVQGRSLPRLR